MDDLVRESGISKSNIYYHFKSKEDLLLAVVDYRIRVFEEGIIAPILNTTASPVERLSLLIMAMAAEMAGRNCIGGCPFLSLAVQVSDSHPPVRARISHFFDDLRLLLARVLQSGIESRELREDISAELLASTVVSTLEGAMMLAELRQDSSLIETAGAVTLQLIKKGP
jgi:TetR/AcrR family transcriptional regulator, transcriptional repressor for nem operon